jgi:hypothetical protein
MYPPHSAREGAFFVSARTCVQDGGGPSIKNKDYVWSYDFVMDRTEDARRPKM